MSADPLAQFVDLLACCAPEVARRMRPAPPSAVAALRALSPPLPPEYVRFLALMGGCERGVLSPFMPEDSFDVGHALARHASPEPSPEEDEDDEEEAAPLGPPGDWVFLSQRFEYGDVPSWCLYLAPVTTDAPADPYGRARVAWGYVDAEGQVHDIAHWGSLEELLIHWLFNIQSPLPHDHVAFHHRQENGGDAAVDLGAALAQAGLEVIAGARPEDWFTLLAHADRTWVWLERKPARLRMFGLYTALVAAPTAERRAEVVALILGCVEAA